MIPMDKHHTLVLERKGMSTCHTHKNAVCSRYHISPLNSNSSPSIPCRNTPRMVVLLLLW